MLIRWAIFGMLLVILCANGRAEDIHDKDNHQQPSAPVTAIPQQQDNGASFHGEQPKQDIHADVKIVNPPEKDFYDKASVWISLALVVVALGTGCVIGWQSWETRKAARGAQVAADAALLNAQAFINAERPWILVKAEMAKRWEAGTWYQVVAVNKGRTPAEVISHAENCIVIGIVDSLPNIAEYGKTEPYPSPQIIVPGESVVIGEITEYSLVGKNVADITRFRNMETEGYVYGSIIYRDLLGRPDAAKLYETRWCFSVHTCGVQELLVMEYGWGGTEYTRHT